jgi:uncharacterized membrane protein YqhA
MVIGVLMKSDRYPPLYTGRVKIFLTSEFLEKITISMGIFQECYIIIKENCQCDTMAAENPTIDTPEKRVWLKNLYLISRILVIIAIIGMLITSVMVILTAFAEVFRIISFFMHEGMVSEEAAKFLSVNVTEMIDLYLIGLVLIIMSIGLYQLFIDAEVDLPEWLDTPSFDILKARLLIVVVVILPVMFLGFAATATDGTFIAGLGIAISLVMIAIGYIISIASKGQIERKRLEIQAADQKK